MGKLKIGGLYLRPEHFADEANKTIGQPLVGQDFDRVLSNRRKVTRRLTADGEKAMREARAFLADVGVHAVTFVWDIHCGCSMCPCSPGFKILVETKCDMGNRGRDKERRQLNIVALKESGSVRLDWPASPWWLEAVMRGQPAK